MMDLNSTLRTSGFDEKDIPKEESYTIWIVLGALFTIYTLLKVATHLHLKIKRNLKRIGDVDKDDLYT